ncbi:UNVERIFIED_CONTAM: hypothetical protein GTU68_046822 [Idotea baltica]|nr:hypothetical protein [Idotea baltica]
MVVGDDDQSVYGWRGAKIENIQSFSKDFPSSQIIRLEQNYRSTANILKAANALISHNHGRLGKELWTNDGEGELINLYAAFNEYDEARYVVESIKDILAGGISAQEIAILYRSNAQSRVLEETLLRAQLPYRIYGGQRFFERAEIKNAVAYLQLLDGMGNDSALERVINMPTRGIGEKTIESIRVVARDKQTSMWSALKFMQETAMFSGRTISSLTGFIELIENLKAKVLNMPLNLMVQTVIEQSALLAHYKNDKSEKAQTRIENLEELVSAARAFEQDEDDTLTPLQSFLGYVSLESGDMQADDSLDSIQLMTLHSAKGLEFPHVFLVGVEEGLFPHKMSLEEPGRLEEERRLAYVGITRSMHQLVISYAETRRLYGKEVYSKVSRFVNEIPPELIKEVRLPKSSKNPFAITAFAAERAKMSTSSQQVKHALFGEGVILSFEGSGAQIRVQVNFDTDGSKWLMLSYAKLEAC